VEPSDSLQTVDRMFALGQRFDDPVISLETGRAPVPTPDSPRSYGSYLVLFRDVLFRHSEAGTPLAIFAECGNLVASLDCNDHPPYL